MRLFIFGLLALAGLAHADTIYTSATFAGLNNCEGANCTSQLSTDTAKTAGLIRLPASASIDEFIFEGRNNGVTFEIAIYEDDKGAPGTLVTQEVLTLITPAPSCDALCREASSTNGRLVYHGFIANPEMLTTESYWFAPVETSGANWSWTMSRGRVKAFLNGVWIDTPRTDEPLGEFAFQLGGLLATVENLALQEHLRGYPALGWAEGQVGLASHPWNRKVDTLPLHPDSDKKIAYMHAAELTFGGDKSLRGDANADTIGVRDHEILWKIDMGANDRVNDQGDQEAYGQNIHSVTNSTPTSTWGVLDDSFFADRGCDRLAMPIPSGLRVQANNGKTCGPSDFFSSEQGDCHYLTLNVETGKAREMWHAYGPGSPPGVGDKPDDEYGATGFWGGCTVEFDLSEPLPFDMRPEPGITGSGLGCTSANGAGIPYTPLLVTPGEIKRGRIEHALAFQTYNFFIEPDTFVQWDGISPAGGATHNPPGTTQSNWADAADTTAGLPPFPGIVEYGLGWDTDIYRQMVYGDRLRLRADFVIQPNWPNALKVILVALKEYGAILMDGTFGGNWFSTTNDAFDDAKWTDPDVALHPLALEMFADIQATDFEIVSGTGEGSHTASTCTRTPINEF